MNVNRSETETETEELKRFLAIAAEAGKELIEDFERDRAKRAHYKVMESLSRRMWRNGDRD